MSEPAGSGPPPLPPPLRRADPAPPQPRPSGCLVALLVGAGLTIPLLAFLAALAVPAYQDDRAHSMVAAALAETASPKPRVAAFAAGHGRCPGSDDPGFDAGTPGGAHAGVAFGAPDIGCVMEIALNDARGGPLDGSLLWLELDADSTWRCSSDADDRYLPRHCRG